MIGTLTNLSAVNTLNALDTQTVGVFGPAQSNAVGGGVKYPLPHPFSRNGSVAPSGTKVLSVHPQDFRWQPTMGSNPEPRDALNGLIQAGVISLSFAAETPIRETEEKFASVV
jgi:hypothetical protein